MKKKMIIKNYFDTRAIKEINQTFFVFPDFYGEVEVEEKTIVHFESLFKRGNYFYVSLSSYHLDRRKMITRKWRSTETKELLYYELKENREFLEKRTYHSPVSYEIYKDTYNKCVQVRDLKSQWDIYQETKDYGIEDYELEFAVKRFYKHKKPLVDMKLSFQFPKYTEYDNFILAELNSYGSYSQ